MKYLKLAMTLHCFALSAAMVSLYFHEAHAWYSLWVDLWLYMPFIGVLSTLVVLTWGRYKLLGRSGVTWHTMAMIASMIIYLLGLLFLFGGNDEYGFMYNPDFHPFYIGLLLQFFVAWVVAVVVAWSIAVESVVGRWPNRYGIGVYLIGLQCFALLKVWAASPDKWIGRPPWPAILVGGILLLLIAFGLYQTWRPLDVLRDRRGNKPPHRLAGPTVSGPRSWVFLFLLFVIAVVQVFYIAYLGFDIFYWFLKYPGCCGP